MTQRTQLLLVLALSAAAGAGAAMIGVTQADGPAFVILLVLGTAAILLSIVGAIGTVRWLNPAARLPEHLRGQAGRPSDWRNTVVSLELQDSTRITCVAIRPGGYVTRRATDPPFDARRVVAVVPATEADFEAERARQRQR